MQDRRVVVAMMLMLALVFLWPQLYDFVGTKMGYDMHPRPVEQATTQPTTAESISSASAATEPSTAPAIVSASGFHVASADQSAQTIILGSAEKGQQFLMAVTLSTKGAGIEQLLLNEFQAEAQSPAPFIFQLPYAGFENVSRPLATRSISVNGTAIDVSTAQWTLESSDQHSATFLLTLEDAGQAKLKIHKTFQLTPKSDPGGGYEIEVSQRFENLTDQPISVHAVFNGPTTPPHESDRGGDRYVLAGYANKTLVLVAHDGIEGFTEKLPSKEYIKDTDGNPLAWAGVCSTYFNALIHPQPQAGQKGIAGYIQSVVAGALNPSAAGLDHLIAMAITTTELNVAPHDSVELPIRAFFGPRRRELLKDDYYASFPRMYSETLVLTSGPCAVCTFQWLIDILVGLLNGLHYILFKDWGLAIIGLVVIVRILLHPITKRSQISMSKMSKMGPEMERLKKKYGDNKEELNKAMVDFYKEQGATPVLGCLPMFLQTPIWIALWQALQTTFELRQAPFLEFFGHSFTWIHDLSRPDHLITLAHPINIGFLPTISGLNLLPLLLAVVFWIQAKMQPKPVAVTPEQVQQQKMMQWMTLLFPVMLYGGPSGLNLYIMTSTGIGIVESKIIRDHIKQREEAEKAGRVIVDAGKKFKSGGGAMPFGKTPDKPKTGGIMGWIANLQAKAEQLRREADKRK